MATPTTADRESGPAAGSLLAHVRAHRAELLAVAARYGATNLRLFGSTVRGEERPDSDVDILADLPDDISLFGQIGLQQELSAILGREVDLVEAVAVHSYVAEYVFAEAIPL